MRKYYFIYSFLLLPFFSSSQIDISKIGKKIIKTNSKISEKETSKGLMEALKQGSRYAVQEASKKGGFNNNQLIRIPFPKEAKKIKKTLSEIGFQKSIQDFESKMNEAAENASKEALDILIAEVKNIKIKDAFKILKGEENAATLYLKEQSYSSLETKFSPIIKTSMEKINIYKYWNPLIKKYNSIPFSKKINPNLEEYITTKAIDGLFF
ncbi:MAG: hypothetical protein CMD08_02470 [Flavobacteriales bacterium]|nr:hypothetical protein [Flavobacteriales bacterium]